MQNSSSIVLSPKMTASQRSARSLLLSFLSGIKHGTLTIIEHFHSENESRVERFGESSPEFKSGQVIHAVIEVKHAHFYHRVLHGGSIAAGEAYMEAWWDSPDLTAVMQLMAANLTALDRLEKKVGWLTNTLRKFSHWSRRNTIEKSKQNIHAHYDLGNDLYQQFLDPSMLYSSGLYNSDHCDLEQAQINKMERLCQQLTLNSDDHVIEIGTGWGAMAIYMVQSYGCRVTTTTISDEQHDYAKQQIEAAGLTDKITLLKQDYRELQGKYDKLVSIEMIEAVGKEFLPSYIQKCHSLLKPGGIMAIQSITIADQRYDSYSNQVDFIQKYIFPGGFLPSVTSLLGQITQYSGFRAVNLFDMGFEYARTLRDWHNSFNRNIEQVLDQGYDERFIRMWRYYLSYCEGGFLASSISAIQLTLVRPME